MSDRKQWEQTGKSSESCFRMRRTDHKHGRKQKEHTTEILRMENSYGNIAFGQKKNKKKTIMISEKRRHNKPGISSIEKKLKEKGRAKEICGDSHVFTNMRDRDSGAMAFEYRKEMKEDKIMGSMKDYINCHRQDTMRQLLPFLETEKDKEKIIQLKDRSTELKSLGLEKEARVVEKEKEKYETMVEEKSEKERQLNQNLLMAIKEMGSQKIRKSDLDFVLNCLSAPSLAPPVSAEEVNPDETEENTKINKKNKSDDSIVYYFVEQYQI